jgi:tetratricopeptide (TPR) repeat protein
VLLVSETATAMQQVGRNAESLALVDAALADFGLLAMEDMEKALLQRRRGYALVEMGRYDEALTAYRTSLTLDPTNRLAANEIAYIEERKAGGGAKPTRTLTSKEASAPGDAPLPFRNVTPPPAPPVDSAAR